MKVYTIHRNGVDLTVQLSEEDAKRLGAKLVTPKVAPVKARAPRNKARTPNDK